MIAKWMTEAAAHAENLFAKHGVRMTLGGEPTFLPLNPEGPEWTYAAVGPTKLDYARRIAENLQQSRMRGAAAFFCPGKSYPGEVNPRWAIRLLANRDGSVLFEPAATIPATEDVLRETTRALSNSLGVPAHWVAFRDPMDANARVLAMPLDHDGVEWHSGRWQINRGDRVLSEAEGPPGLRLPLELLPASLPRRAVTLSLRGSRLAVFFPPLLQAPFLDLLHAVEEACQSAGGVAIELEGYTPFDEGGQWTTLGLTADPGVLEINLPACASWTEYAEWMETVTASCEQAGLRSWKETPWDSPQGTGGGNHLLWGGPSLETNPFFARPKWLAAILRFWQRHPSLAYLFTGCYVGSSSQAPRPDESSTDLYDIEMAYTFLESLPAGDHRQLISETLRHLHTDVTGNAHRSETSFDKFWNPGWPGGMLGLIEFRAIESLPRADWMSAVALLWTCLAARLLNPGRPTPLKRFDRRLHDEFFLPARLWMDLEEVLAALDSGGFKLERGIYRDIWNWRFPVVLGWTNGAAQLTARKALEGWPLLSETPIEGGMTSRFVDTSMHRLEFQANESFLEQYEIHAGGRPLALRKIAPEVCIVGLRYRKTNLYPALHPGIPVQMPLEVTLVEKTSGRVAARLVLKPDAISFQPASEATDGPVRLGGRPCRRSRPGELTFDLRLE